MAKVSSKKEIKTKKTAKVAGSISGQLENSDKSEKVARAILKRFRQSPRKMRGVSDLVRGKKVSEALLQLQFVNKKASEPIRKLIASALANAKSMNIETDSLVVKKIAVDNGAIMYRRRPASRGSAHPIRKRTSHILVELGTK